MIVIDRAGAVPMEGLTRALTEFVAANFDWAFEATNVRGLRLRPFSLRDSNPSERPERAGILLVPSVMGRPDAYQLASLADGLRLAGCCGALPARAHIFVLRLPSPDLVGASRLESLASGMHELAEAGADVICTDGALRQARLHPGYGQDLIRWLEGLGSVPLDISPDAQERDKLFRQAGMAWTGGDGGFISANADALAGFEMSGMMSSLNASRTFDELTYANSPRRPWGMLDALTFGLDGEIRGLAESEAARAASGMGSGVPPIRHLDLSSLYGEGMALHAHAGIRSRVVVAVDVWRGLLDASCVSLQPGHHISDGAYIDVVRRAGAAVGARSAMRALYAGVPAEDVLASAEPLRSFG